MTITARLVRRLSAAAAVTALAGLVLAGPASAHVTVSADDAHAGASDAILSFRVPDEEATASTVKVAVSFPTKTPLPSVRPAAKPGWTITTTRTRFDPPITTDDGTITDGVSQVVWTATTPSAAVPPGGFDTFQVLVGPLPDKVSTLAFPTVQTYDNGTVASWITPVTDPADEPENPAPTLALLPAAASAAPAPVTTPAAAGSDTTGRTLSVAALVVAAASLVTSSATLVLLRRRRTA